MTRYDFIPFKNGKMVDLGGHYVGTLSHALQQATVLGMYGYDSISIECNGVIVDVVKFGKMPVYRP
jgi:hypothetical protein